jgi:diguanylate cyclase (GGDEF)-like protein
VGAEALGAGLLVLAPIAALAAAVVWRPASLRDVSGPWILIAAAAAAAFAGQIALRAGEPSAPAGPDVHLLLITVSVLLFAVASGWLLYRRCGLRAADIGMDGAFAATAAVAVIARWAPAASTLADGAAGAGGAAIGGALARVAMFAAPAAAGAALLFAGALATLRADQVTRAASIHAGRISLLGAAAAFVVATTALASGAAACCVPGQLSGFAFAIGWLCVGGAALTLRPAATAGRQALPADGGRARLMLAPAAAVLLTAILADAAWRAPLSGTAALATGALGLVLTARVFQLLLVARTLSEERVQLARSRALVELSQALSGTTRLDETLRLITEWTVRLLDGRAASLELVTADGDVLEVRAVHGLPAEVLQLRIPVHHSFTGRTMIERRARVRSRVADEPYSHEATERFFADAPLAAAPLYYGDRTLGALACVGYRPFSAEGLELLGALAEQAAVAIENARLFQQVHQLSLTDPLTGLANRRQLERDLTREFAAARRGRRLVAVMFDLNGFKEYNDRWGHLAGDEALRLFGTALAGEMRAMNMAARYGGDEFLVLLADADIAGAEIFIERVRRNFPGPDADHRQATLTVAAGIAEYTPEMSSPEELVAAADDALYVAKPRRRT